jgi:hypothetical protein
MLPLIIGLGFLRARFGNQHAKIGLQSAMNRILQSEPVRDGRSLLSASDCDRQEKHN